MAEAKDWLKTGRVLEHDSDCKLCPTLSTDCIDFSHQWLNNSIGEVCPYNRQIVAVVEAIYVYFMPEKDGVYELSKKFLKYV